MKTMKKQRKGEMLARRREKIECGYKKDRSEKRDKNSECVSP